MADSNHCDEETPLLLSCQTDDKDSIQTASIQLNGQGLPCDVGNLDDRSWRSRLRNAEFRTKVIRSLEMCLCGFTVGMATGQLGPALLDLQIITQTTVQEASTFLTAASAGNILGSAVSGFIYDHLSKDLLLILSELFMGLMLLVIPFSSDYWLMVTSCFVLNVFRISTGLTANVELFRMWGEQATTLALAFQFSFSMGGIVVPLITEPFLVSKNDTAVIDHTNCSTNYTLDLQLHSDCDLVTDPLTDAAMPEAQSTRVHFAFIITSMASIFVTAILVVEYVSKKVKGTSSKSMLNEDEQNAPTTSEGGRDCQDVRKPPESYSGALNLPMVPYIAVVIWMSCFFLMNVANQSTAYSYLETFAVLEMGWTKSQGAFLSSLYWISIACTQLTCIFVASYFTPLQLLAISFVVLIPSHLLFVFMSMYHVDVGVWISTVLYAAALSPTYPSFISWMNYNLITLTGKVNSCIGLSSHAGALLSLSILGYLIEDYGAIWFGYVMLVEVTLDCLLFVGLFLFTRLYLQPKYNVARTDVIVMYCATNDGSAPTAHLK